jgi:hypothetical protein
MNPEGDKIDEKFRAPVGLLLGLGVGGSFVIGVAIITVWDAIAKDNQTSENALDQCIHRYFKRGRKFVVYFSTVYFSILAVVFLISGVSVGIAWGVLKGQQCVS